jgi:hypothetical protein
LLVRSGRAFGADSECRPQVSRKYLALRNNGAVNGSRPNTMPFPIPALHVKLVAAPAAIVRVTTREDVLWNRPVFKAPPLPLLVPIALAPHPTPGGLRSVRVQG